MASGAKIPLFDGGKFIGCRSASVIEGLLVNPFGLAPAQ
jgi:hypothetical protein